MNKINNRLTASLIALFLVLSCCGGLLIFKFEELWARFVALIGAFISSGLSIAISFDVSVYQISKKITLTNRIDSSINYGNLINNGEIVTIIHQATQNEDASTNGISLDSNNQKS